MTSGFKIKTSVCIESDDIIMIATASSSAEHMRYAVTKDPEALLTASKFLMALSFK